MARNREKNVAIGTALCPFKNCDIEAPLFRFRRRSDNERMSRLAGKLYLNCPKHGRTADQEWLLANANITGENSSQQEASVEPEPAAETPPAPKAETEKETADDAWGFF